MKKYSLKLSKMQRKVRARRKTWTSKERHENRLKNAARIAKMLNHGQRLAEQFIQEAERELAQEAQTQVETRKMDGVDGPAIHPLAPGVHVHSDTCAHGHTHDE
jgi:hypothetical protein